METIETNITTKHDITNKNTKPLTLNMILSKMKHGTLIRYKETGAGFSTFDITGTSKLNDRIRITMCGSTIGYYKPDNVDFEPFEQFCIYLKIRGKNSFYVCDERGLFDTNQSYSTLNEFAISFIKMAFPTFKGTQVDTLNYLEYYCKDRKEWFKLCEHPIT